MIYDVRSRWFQRLLVSVNGKGMKQPSGTVKEGAITTVNIPIGPAGSV